MRRREKNWRRGCEIDYGFDFLSLEKVKIKKISSPKNRIGEKGRIKKEVETGGVLREGSSSMVAV